MLQLLGSFQPVKENTAKRLSLNQTTSLLVYLAFQGDWVSRSELSFLYWPDVDEATSRYNLRQLIYRARKLAWVENLEITDEALRWAVATDFQSFKDACAKERWEEACQYYGGSFLAGQVTNLASFDNWLELTRRDLEEQWIGASLHYAAELERRKQYTEAAAHLQKVLAHNSLAETIVQALMRCLYQANERDQALEVFRTFETQLHDELALEPSSETAQLIEAIESGEPLNIHPHNLPAQVTTFFGREEEIAFISERLGDASCRLLTITGPGGIGKTRLALEAAARQLGHFKHGVYLVALASVTSPEGVLSAVADALLLTFSANRDPKAQLSDYLREKDLLLVLDNFEHLLGAAPLLSNLLKVAPGLALLISSRERLNLRGEWVVELDGLPVPGEDEPRLGDFTSVQLFLESAKRLKPQLSLTTENAPTIAEICRLVDGLPLALELAAGWVQMLSPRAIADEIRRDLNFLETDLQDVPERHRSVRAVFESSWQRLSKEKQIVFKKLSVFHGGFTQEAAKTVTGMSLKDLLTLMQRSLVRQTPDGRFDLHELLKQFASDKLALNQQDLQTVQTTMSEYYLTLLISYADSLNSSAQVDSLPIIRADIANSRAAIIVALETNRLEKLSEALAVLDRYYHLRGRLMEARDLFTHAVTVLENGAETDPTLLNQCQLYLAAALQKMGEMAASRAYLNKVAKVIGKTHSNEQTLLLNLFAKDAFVRGRFEDAKKYYQQVLTITDEQGSALYRKVILLNSLGDVAIRMGKLQQAQAYCEEALTLARRYAGTKAVATTLSKLADLACNAGEYKKATAYFHESLELRRHLGDAYGTALEFNNLATLHHITRHLEKAKPLYEESLNLCKRLGDRPGVAYALGNLGELAFDQGNCQEAIALLEQALDLSLKLDMIPNVIKTRIFLGSCYLADSKFKAKSQLREALKQALELRAAPLILDVLVGVGRFFVTSGSERALELIGLLLHHPSSYEDVRVMARELLTKLDQKPSDLMPAKPPENLQTYALSVMSELDAHDMIIGGVASGDAGHYTNP